MGLNVSFFPSPLGVNAVGTTTVNGHGWDGRIKGKQQGSGTYAWLVRGVDYEGKPFFAKGTVTLIR